MSCGPHSLPVGGGNASFSCLPTANIKEEEGRGGFQGQPIRGRVQFTQKRPQQPCSGKLADVSCNNGGSGGKIAFSKWKYRHYFILLEVWKTTIHLVMISGSAGPAPSSQTRGSLPGSSSFVPCSSAAQKREC
ncbi:hypothetical protein GOODEAATRI_031959 [Goodea atripinnis]|uniref:Uncharacterized protein n=1 Tax=Goodea atripinnis TaxID=208336 RepID=A0ABV0N5X1_9TELE